MVMDIILLLVTGVQEILAGSSVPSVCVRRAGHHLLSPLLIWCLTGPQ